MGFKNFKLINKSRIEHHARRILQNIRLIDGHRSLVLKSILFYCCQTLTGKTSSMLGCFASVHKCSGIMVLRLPNLECSERTERFCSTLKEITL